MHTPTQPSRLSHNIFVLTLVGKGVLGLMQLSIAAAIVLGLVKQLPTLAHWLVAAELAEDPLDRFASTVIALSRSLPGSDLTFYGIYFALHGLLHVGVVAALLSGSLWAYPAAIAILFGFILYQAFEWLFAGGGTMLLVLSLIDGLVIYLTVLEWRGRTR